MLNPAVPLADSPKSITVDAAVLERYACQYELAPGFILTVSRKEDQLNAQATAQPEFPIFAKSDHEFYWRVVDAHVEFIAGLDGAITSAVHHQNGITFTAPKLKDSTPSAAKP